MEKLLLDLAQNGLGYTLFVLAVGVNVYQYKINQKVTDKRLDDWKTTLSAVEVAGKATQKAQENMSIMVQGIDTSLKILLDRFDSKK